MTHISTWGCPKPECDFRVNVEDGQIVPCRGTTGPCGLHLISSSTVDDPAGKEKKIKSLDELKREGERLRYEAQEFLTRLPAPPIPSDVVTEITSKRGPVYGPFLHNAVVAQNFKAAMRNIPDPDNNRRWEDLPVDVREGLDLIALKISRIVTGDPEYLDNFDDIGGYAKIVADRIRKTKGV